MTDILTNRHTDKLLIATHNAGKLAELRDLLRNAPYELVSLSDVGIEHDVEETGDTLEENAALKAATYARLAGMLTLADDSGLEVDALNGAPGVHSARYAGTDATDADRIAKLLDNLAAHPQPWTARFRCVIAIAAPGGSVELHSGACEGVIISHIPAAKTASATTPSSTSQSKTAPWQNSPTPKRTP